MRKWMGREREDATPSAVNTRTVAHVHSGPCSEDFRQVGPPPQDRGPIVPAAKRPQRGQEREGQTKNTAKLQSSSASGLYPVAEDDRADRQRVTRRFRSRDVLQPMGHSIIEQPVGAVERRRTKNRRENHGQGSGRDEQEPGHDEGAGHHPAIGLRRHPGLGRPPDQAIPGFERHRREDDAGEKNEKSDEPAQCPRGRRSDDERWARGELRSAGGRLKSRYVLPTRRESASIRWGRPTLAGEAC
jgi:hypothetical protein